VDQLRILCSVTTTHNDCAKTGRSAGQLIMPNSINAICREANLCRTVSRRVVSFLSGLTLIVEIEVAYGVSVVAAIVVQEFSTSEESLVLTSVYWRLLFSSSPPIVALLNKHIDENQKY
jgi:hypothetical protein